MASIKDAKKDLKEMRIKILDMNPTQLTNFFKPFSPEKLVSIQKSITKAIDGKKQEVIETKKKEIERLRKELEELNKMGR